MEGVKAVTIAVLRSFDAYLKEGYQFCVSRPEGEAQPKHGAEGGMPSDSEPVGWRRRVHPSRHAQNISVYQKHDP